MNKKEICKEIVDYETNSTNYLNVKERIRLFNNFNELKKHKFFTKFILAL